MAKASNSVLRPAERQHRYRTAHLLRTPPPLGCFDAGATAMCVKRSPKDKASNLQFISAAGTRQTSETHTNTQPPPHKQAQIRTCPFQHAYHCFSLTVSK